MDTTITKHRILIVEDETDLSFMYRTKFEREGFDAYALASGIEAVKHVSEINPDVILLDIMMPGIDGFETLRLLRKKLSATTRIVMFSNLNRPSDRKTAIESGADDYLVKAEMVPREIVNYIRGMLALAA